MKEDKRKWNPWIIAASILFILGFFINGIMILVSFIAFLITFFSIDKNREKGKEIALGGLIISLIVVIWNTIRIVKGF